MQSECERCIAGVMTARWQLHNAAPEDIVSADMHSQRVSHTDRVLMLCIKTTVSELLVVVVLTSSRKLVMAKGSQDRCGCMRNHSKRDLIWPAEIGTRALYGTSLSGNSDLQSLLECMVSDDGVTPCKAKLKSGSACSQCCDFCALKLYMDRVCFEKGQW